MRQAGEAFASAQAAAFEDEGCQVFEIGDAELGKHLQEPAVSGLIRGGQRVDVPDHLVCFPHVVADDVQQVGVHLAPICELHDGDKQPLLIHVAGIGTETPPADVHHVGCAGEVANQ